MPHAEVDFSSSGGPTCPGPMTRADLLALRSGGSLQKDCHYVITDYNRPNVGAAEILLHAVDASTLSMDAKVKTTHDTISWQGRYDIDANRLVGLNDNLGNVVDGPDAVDSFPWGVSTVTDNEVHEAVVNYTSGTFRHNVIHSNATVAVDANVFVRNVIGQSANVTVTGGDFRENVVDSDATVNSSTSGDVDNNHFQGPSVTNVSGSANLDTCRVAKNSNLTLTGGSLLDSSIDEDAEVTIQSGSNYENVFGKSSIYIQDGSGYIRYTEIGGTSTVRNGDTNISNCSFYQSSTNTTGSSGQLFNSDFRHSVLNGCQNIASLTIQYSSLHDRCDIAANGAARLYMYYCNLSSYARIRVSAGARLDASRTEISNYSYITVSAGVLLDNYSKLTSLSYIQHSSAGTNRTNRVDGSSSGRVRFLGTCNNCQVYYSSVRSGAHIEHRGSSSGCYFYYCDVSSSSSMYSNNSVNLRGYYNSLSGNSQLYSDNVSATHYMYYNVGSAHGYLRIQNASGGRMYAVHCSGQAIAWLRGSTPAGRLYYSSFHAYYYLYANNWTVTRFALHGYGRRTYTVTNPPNGTFVQNF